MASGDQGEFPLLAYIDELVDKLREHVPEALKEFDPKAVHAARVATRRLKAAVDLMEWVLSKGRRKPFAKVLRKLRRRLGPLRDIDVMMDHLNDLDAAEKFPLAAAWLREGLRSERQAVREKSTGKGSPGDVLSRLGTWWGLREEVLEARQAVDSLLAESLHLQIDAFAERADRLAAEEIGKSADENPADGGKDARQDPHEIRIAAKALRYTLEMAEVQGHALPAPVLKKFKRMQEMLGLWHDFVVLTERAMKGSVDALLAHHDAAAQEQVLDLARLTLRRASQQLAHFSALWRERGAELTESIRSSFPLTQPVGTAAPLKPDLVQAPLLEANAPQTDRDPSGSTRAPDPAPASQASATDA